MKGTSLQKILFYLGLVLFIPGLLAFGSALYNGPSAWSTDARSYWGVPIALFVFWIGLAHAGTLLSAIFLALGIRLDHRTAMLAELSTLCCLAIAGIFPLMHLGVIENFYMVIPFADARGNFANVMSPLVWDFCCIAVYGILSLLFFWTQLKAKVNSSFEKLRKPVAWILFPLVLWVHTVVSLDFASTLVPEWRGAFFPVYFIAGAVYSGLALVNGLLCLEGFRVRLLERLTLAVSWLLLVVWLWNFLLKGDFCTSAFILAGVIPQLLLVESVRDSRAGRGLISLSVLFGLWAERFYMVMPSFGVSQNCSLNYTDLGLIAFSAGTFFLLFLGLRRVLASYVSDAGTFFGEVDGSDIAKNEIALGENVGHDSRDDQNKDSYVAPWSTEEFRLLRMPLLCGILGVVLFSTWSLNQNAFEHVYLTLVNILPMMYPIVALVAIVVLYLRYFWRNNLWKSTSKIERYLVALLLVMGGLFAGAFYAGGPSEPSPYEPTVLKEMASEPSLLWNARCSSCHGTDGNFNRKFVREFYPVPQKLTLDRLDSLGVDSLAHVILNGRGNMNAYLGRLTKTEAKALVEYMRMLARNNEQKNERDAVGEVD